MVRESPPLANPARPLPVARLYRHSLNAKSAKEGHDAAYFAWEVSIRLAVAASPPADASRLRVGSVGEWVRALQPGLEVVSSPALLALYSHLAKVVEDRHKDRANVRTRDLLNGVAAYRNMTIGHGTIRERESFYTEGARLLREGLDEAWELGLFLPVDSRIVFTTGVVPDAGGGVRAFTLDIGQENPVVDPTEGVVTNQDVSPSTVYVCDSNGWRSLHPWVLFDDRRMRLYCFQALKRRPEYLDFGSGEFLRGDGVEILAPGTMAALQRLLGEAPAFAEKPRAVDEREFGDYLLLGLLGEGGMGRVHLAEQRSLGRLVALKVLPRETARDPVALARFRREIEALGRCEHPNVVKIFESGVEGGVPYYAMEYVQGADLRHVAGQLRGRGSLDEALVSAWEEVCEARPEMKGVLPDVDLTELRSNRSGQGKKDIARARQMEIARIVRDAALGVQSLHDQGILHRDISPANIVVTVPDRRAVVMDLGLASLEGRELSMSLDRTRILGTLRYMAPEQIDGTATVDRRADVYGLGAVLYELLSDRPIFDGETQVRLMEQVLNVEPTSLVGRTDLSIDRDLDLIVRKATDKDASVRYGSAADLARDLSAFLDGRPISARPATPGYLLRRWVQRNRLLAASILVGTVGTLIALSIALGFRVSAYHEKAQGALLSDLQTARALKSKAQELPRAPDDWQEGQDFISKVDELRSRLPQHDSLTREARNFGPDRIVQNDGVQARSPADEASRSTPDPQLVSQLELLRMRNELQDCLDSLGSSSKGTIQRIAAEIATGQSLRERSIVEPANEWTAAIEYVSHATIYSHMVLKPQLGLVPIGPDPESQLYEFALIATGSAPVRGGEGGHLIIDGDSSIVLVLIPGGHFMMGANQCSTPRGPLTGTECGGVDCDACAGEDEGPVRSRDLSPFFLSKYELTQGQWLRMNPDAGNPGKYHPGLKGAGSVGLSLASPVEGIVAGKLYQLADATLRRFGLELPHEAQWEYAARAGTASPWPVMEATLPKWDSVNCADSAVGEYRKWNPDWEYSSEFNDGCAFHAKVDWGRPNAYGLHCMNGNVMEWTADTKWSYALGVDLDGVPIGQQFDPSPNSEPVHIARGGSWVNRLIMTRSSHRYEPTEQVNSASLGLRPMRRLL